MAGFGVALAGGPELGRGRFISRDLLGQTKVGPTIGEEFTP